MRQIYNKELVKATPIGNVRLRSFCTPADLAEFEFDAGFSSGKGYKTLFTGRESIEREAHQPDTNLVLAITGDNRIIGFAILAFPERGERWAELGPGIMMEVKAIEVVPRCRSAGIAGSMLQMLLDHSRIEDRIIYMVGYSWTWDLAGNRMTAEQYRRMVLSLFKPCGFEQYHTNEPNICLKPENLFMCRIGKNVSELVLYRFKWLRFGLSPLR